MHVSKLADLLKSIENTEDMNIDMQALIEEMSVLIEKIKSGTATLGELEAFTAAASELHQRSIILRYKAYEAKVFGTTETVTSQPEAVEVVAETPTPEPVIEPAAEITTEPEPVSEEISFDLFGESDESAEMDLFSEEPVVAETTPEVALHVVTDADEAVITEEPMATEATLEPVPEITIEEEVVAEITPELVVAEEPAAPVMEESTPVSETPKPEPVVAHGGNEHPVYSRLSTEDNSLAARLMAVRLESLKGAFGFNERLQIIQELFNGSNDAFTQAIEHIDTLSSKSEARMLVSRYAHQFEWDKDSNLALEFVQKVERRFA